MKIETEHHGWDHYHGEVYSAVDMDTYDGAPDSNSKVGWGNSERDAINDLVEQIVEELEEKIDTWVTAEWKSREQARLLGEQRDQLFHHLHPEKPLPLRYVDRGDLGSGHPLSSPCLNAEKPVAGILDASAFPVGCEYDRDIPFAEDLEDKFAGRLPDEPEDSRYE